MLPVHQFLVTFGNMAPVFFFTDFVGSVYFSTKWTYGKNQNMQSLYSNVYTEFRSAFQLYELFMVLCVELFI